ncbi:MAG: glycosyltransferase family 9 protein [Steroidobacteraceae bacterium]
MLSNIDKPQRIVIYRLGSLGDTVVALPCFHKVAQTWPNAERIVLTNFPVSSKAAPLEKILREGGLIHDAIAYPVGTRSIGELWLLVKHLRTLDADVLVYLTPARGLFNAFRDWVFFKCCGFKEIVGAPLSGDLQTCRQTGAGASRETAVEERECERLARCLKTLGPIDLDDPGMWDLKLTEREMRAGAAILASLTSMPYFAINTGGKAGEKDWGVRNWRSLLERLSEDYADVAVLIVGAAEDAERARQISSAWSGPVVDACGKLSPRESAAAMRHALAFIGHDSGPLHLAAAAGVCCVGLFGSFNQPKRWHPRGRQHRIIHRMNGLHTITVAEVQDAVHEIVPVRQEYA